MKVRESPIAIMASASGGRRKRLVSTLEGEVLERLSMKLNPRMLMKDYQSLAGRLKYTYEYIRNFARERDPTLALLQHWWSSNRGREKTVSVLIEYLIDMERDDAVDLLRPHEFYSSQGASDNDETERPVIAGAIDLNVNPYNPYFPAREDFQRQANQNGSATPDLRANQFSEHQRFQDQRENEHHQRNASPPGVLSQRQWSGYAHQDPMSQKMFNMSLNNNYPENPSTMVPTTSPSFPNGSYPSNYPSAVVPTTSGSFPNESYSSNYPSVIISNAPTSFPNPESRASSVSSSMDSLQFEKYFQEKENVAPKPPTSPPSPQYHAPELPRRADNTNMLIPASDDIYARRDLRFNAVRMSRPHPLDGSSMSSSAAGVHPEYIGGYESTAAAGTHSITAAADKVALVIGNQDYAHDKLRGLLYPEQDAADVADALTRLNFKVISLVNLTLEEMRTAMLAFCCLLGRGVYGVVYYAGHGYEDNGENYLLPVDSDIKYNREKSLRTQEILEAMQQCETSLNLLIIDACRVSLPNKTGTKVPRIKRNATGNNIFAFSCCSQQESLEQSNCRNGMYCSHLLRRLGENRRVENILMDVAQDFARACNLPQRPCLETDSMVDFRLTDPIQPEILEGLEQEFLERCRRWLGAKYIPPGFVMAAASLEISFKFSAPFSNILCVSVVTERKMEQAISEFHLRLETVSPLRCVLKACDEPTHDNVICRQKYEIQNIQKHTKLKGHIMLTVTAMFREDDKLCQIEKEVDLLYPLVASITCLWDHWLLGDRCKTTAV